MSAPTRVKDKAEQVPTEEAVRAEQPEQPKPADSDFARETPRIMFPKLTLEYPEESLGTGQENEHASAKPQVVRTLKDPPEIWDLVHETPAHFDPTEAFVARLTSRKTELILAVLAVMFISGLAAFAVMTLRDGRNPDGAAAQLQEDRGTSQAVSASRASAPASAPESAMNAPVNAEVNTSPSPAASAPEPALNAPVNISTSAESVVDKSPSQPAAPAATDSQPAPRQLTVPSPDNAAFAGQASTDSIQPTGVSEARAQANGAVVNNISKRNAWRAGRVAALSGNKRVTVASGGQNADKPGNNPADNSADKPADKPRPSRATSPAAGHDTGAKPPTPQAPRTAERKEGEEKSSTDSASANKGSSPTPSPKLIAPPTATSAPKAKVIQWP